MNELTSKIIKDLFLKFNTFEDQKKLYHEFLFDITSMCNLNCTNCSVFCGLREPYYITVEDFRLQLEQLTSTVPVHFISFCGGEPTLHPQFMELCKEVFKQLPECFLQIITNGTLLDKFSDEDLQFLSQYKVSFAITLYPKAQYINTVQNFENKCKTNFPNLELSIKGIRPYFGKYDYNFEGTNDPDDFYYLCEKSHQCHSFVIFKNRIYNCCIAPDYNAIGLPKDDADSIPINELKSYEELLTFGNHSYSSCKYCTACRTVGQPLHFWHQQIDTPSEYNLSLLETYLYKYDLYYKLYHTFGEIPQCLQNEYFLSKEDKEEHAICDPVSHFKKRFFDGQLDILIPFDANCSIIYCRDWLYNQKDLDKCNIYFVSLNAGPEAETAVYHSYIPLNDTKISIWYLKANNIEEALKEFSEISFLDKKLILSDYGLLANNNLLSDVINNYNNLSISKNDLQELFK